MNETSESGRRWAVVRHERWSTALGVLLGVVTVFGLLSLVVKAVLSSRALLAALLALGLTACTAAQLKADAAVAASDLETSGLILSGIAAQAKAHPDYLAAAAPVVTTILGKVGVPASTASKIGSGLSEGNVDKLAQAGAELQAAGAVVGSVAQ